MSNRAVRRRTIRLLGSLPLIAQFARRLQIQPTIDRLCPSRSNALMTHGQVALAIIANRLTTPKAMYQILAWAQKWGVRETWGILPDFLNDDRLGRCMDGIAPQIDAIQGETLVHAVWQYELELSQLHWDLTSVVLRGEYPPEEQAQEYAQPAYGFGGEAGCKQLRVGECVTADGGVPIWYHAFDGQTADVGTVVAQMEALRQQMPLPECLVIGDTKLLAEEVLAKLRGQKLHFLAPLAAHKDLDEQFLALDPLRWETLSYVAQRQERLPEEQRTQYVGQEVSWEWKNPKTGATEVFRRLYVISSEERATCRKVREQQMARAEAELAKMARGLGQRQLKSTAQVEARVAATLSKRRVTPFYEVTISEAGGVPTLSWAVNTATLQRAEALDGYYVLLCSWSKEQATSSELLGKWKQEAVIERRYSDWKGPLRVRPVFVTSNQRMVALMLLLHLSLMIYCLIEREARRRLAEQGRTKMARLLAGHVAAVPTGENLLLAFEHLFLIIEEEEHGRYYEMTALDALQRELWQLLKIEPIEWF